MDKPTLKKENAGSGIKLLIATPIMAILLFFLGFLFFGMLMTTFFTTIQLLIMENKGFKNSWKEAREETIKILQGITG